MDIFAFRNVDATDLPSVMAVLREDGGSVVPPQASVPVPTDVGNVTRPQVGSDAASTARQARSAYAAVKSALGRKLSDSERAIVKSLGYDVDAAVARIGGTPQATPQPQPQVDPQVAALQAIAAQLGLTVGAPEATPTAQTTVAVQGGVPQRASALSDSQRAALVQWGLKLVAPHKQSALQAYLAGRATADDLWEAGIKQSSVKRALAV